MPLSIDGLLKKQSSGTFDRSLCQGETPRGRILQGGAQSHGGRDTGDHTEGPLQPLLIIQITAAL